MEMAKDLNMESDEMQLAGCLGAKRCGEKNSGSGRNAQAALRRRTFPYG